MAIDPCKQFVCDLDGTLYRETDYVISGLRAVATALATGLAKTKGQQSMASQYYAHMRGEFLANGRARVFSTLIERYSIAAPMKAILSVYRQHTPHIKLYPDAAALLDRIGHDITIITNTPRDIALRKRAALGLTDATLVADAGKPAPDAFRAVAGILDGPLVYVGDDPLFDVDGARAAGMETVIVDRLGVWREGCDADLVVSSLDALG